MQDLAFDKISIDEVFISQTNATSYSVLRLDKIHPLISGNKWYKLRYYLEQAKEEDLRGIITFGGPYSNHLLATAAACKMNGIESIGIVRGEEPAKYSTTLLDASSLGMTLVFSSREDYKAGIIPEDIPADEFLIVNEGGYGEAGARGASHMIEGLADDFTHFCCAVGTGTMLAGLASAARGKKVTGISVLKNNFELEDAVTNLTSENHNWSILHDYHFGGYGKHPPELIDFMNEFYSLSNIPSDIVYTGKLFFAMEDLIRRNYFPEESKILVIHSGGLQGNNSLQKGTLIY